VASGGGKWVEKYWAPMNYPVFGRGSREITHVVHQVFDFTRTLQLRQRVEEQIIANEEQQSTVEEMLRQLKSDRRDLDIARKRLSEIVHAPDEPQPLVNELSKRLGSLDANSYLSAGYSAPRSGVYDVFHKKACRFALSPIFLRAGDKLRPCYYCRHEIRYRFSKPFEICP
jgi:hypothetical protein